MITCPLSRFVLRAFNSETRRVSGNGSNRPASPSAFGRRVSISLRVDSRISSSAEFLSVLSCVVLCCAVMRLFVQLVLRFSLLSWSSSQVFHSPRRAVPSHRAKTAEITELAQTT